MNTDTPLPPDEPTAPNPPEGAIINYYLKSARPARSRSKSLARMAGRFANTRAPTKCSPRSGHDYGAAVLVPSAPRAAGDGRHAPLHVGSALPADRRFDGSGQGARLGGPNLPIAAIGRNTVPNPTTPWVNPGTFTVKLTVNGKTSSQPLT
jgi:hypothetical protein